MPMYGILTQVEISGSYGGGYAALPSSTKSCERIPPFAKFPRRDEQTMSRYSRGKLLTPGDCHWRSPARRWWSKIDNK